MSEIKCGLKIKCVKSGNVFEITGYESIGKVAEQAKIQCTLLHRGGCKRRERAINGRWLCDGDKFEIQY